jgi:enamine deaminase RidA (YjgF/YER057c/UK114 family)
MSLRHLTIGPGSTLGTDEPVISDVVEVGDLLFLSGRAAVDPATLAVVEPSRQDGHNVFPFSDMNIVPQVPHFSF